jgi:hypothetical protein
VRGALARLELARSDDDVRARFGEPERHAKPDTGRTARDDAHASLEVQQFFYVSHSYSLKFKLTAKDAKDAKETKIQQLTAHRAGLYRSRSFASFASFAVNGT